MLRRLCLLALILGLSACASTYEYYGAHSPVVEDAYVESYPAAGYAGAIYLDDPYWYDYPAYYSLFWSINRGYADPFWYPHFYYGVTWFPRNYYSVTWRHWPGRPLYWPRYGRLAYSPYRWAWVDDCYDWYPWYRHQPSYYQRWYPPRYGNARHEAERLSHWRSSERRSIRYETAAGWPPPSPRSQAGVRERRDDLRGAAYSGRSSRVDPGVRGFNQPERSASVGRSRQGEPSDRAPRVDPGLRGFTAPADATAPTRSEPRRAVGSVLRERPGRAPTGVQSTPPRVGDERVQLRREPPIQRSDELNRSRRAPVGEPRERPEAEGYRLPARSAGVRSPAVERAPLPARQDRSVTPSYPPPRRPPPEQRPSTPERPAYPAPPRYQTVEPPPPRYQPAEPRYQPPPAERAEPRYSRPEPRMERPEPRFERPAARPEPEPREERRGRVGAAREDEDR